MKAQIVSFHCILRDRLGHIISSSFNQDILNQLDASATAADGNSQLRGMVARIQDVRPGERRSFTVPANEAYGAYRLDLVLSARRSELSTSGRLGTGSEVRLKSNPTRTYRVIQLSGDVVTLDGNHPLAGQDLSFDIEFVSARDASREDLEDPSNPAAGPTFH